MPSTTSVTSHVTLYVVFTVLLTLTTYCVAASPLSRDDMRTKMLRTYFGCPTCDPAACPDVSACVEQVKEPGTCACCMVCALGEGEPCGMYAKARCGDGLKCRPSPDDEEPLQSLMLGTATCVKYSGPSFGKFRRGNY